ncbi:MAG: hypothetical protein QOG98_2340, partial [Pseudonocardiales bacterium]|nr:hypothetical protein [Pseudonocardiales bacterium]
HLNLLEAVRRPLGPKHREHPKLGWTCHMLNGIPHWKAPPWLDPQQTPRRNQAHARPLV